MKGRDACFSISFATLFFLSVYALLRSAARLDRNYYFFKKVPDASDHVALIMNIVGLAILLYLLRRWSRSKGAGRVMWRTLLTSLSAISFVGLLRAAGFLNSQTAFVVIKTIHGFSLVSMTMAAAGVVAAILTALIRWPQLLSEIFFTAVAAFSPLAIFVIGASAFTAAAPAPRLEDTPPPLPHRLRGGHGPSVFVFVFDEADYRLMFVDRPANVSLPQIDRLRAQVLFASAALPPANVTVLSIPSLTTGQLFSYAEPIGAYDLLLHFKDSARVARWKSLPNVFDEATAAGLTVGIVGWAHPYCRLFRASRCRWYEIPSQSGALGDSLGEKLINQWRTLFETPRLSPFGQSLVTKRAVQIHLAILRDALAMASDRSIDFKYFHFSIPHSPNIYDLRRRDLSARNDPFRGYFGNLVLMDQTLGDIRRAAESAGLWDESVVIVTSDHWCRDSSRIDGKTDHRVPFLVKMPRQEAPLPYDRSFNTAVSYELLRAVFRRDLTRAEQLPSWLTANAKQKAPSVTAGFD